jgi:hypothetical protein
MITSQEQLDQEQLSEEEKYFELIREAEWQRADFELGVDR